MKVGDLVYYKDQMGVIIFHVQTAWGAHNWKVFLSNGEIKNIWDKHLLKLGKDEDR